MTFTVEDGTGKADANSYLAVDAADSYWSDRANAAWAAKTTGEKQAALIKATDYLTRRYRGRWKGIRTNLNQALDWPRAGVQTEDYFEPESGPRPNLWPGLTGVLPENAVPNEVKQATAELAYRAAAGGANGTPTDLMPDLARGGRIKEETVGPITTVYMDGAPAVTSYQAIDGLLAVLLANNSTVGRLVRS